MALSVETGQFAANTGSATTTVTTGFQGKAVILWGTNGTANTDATNGNAGFSIGFSDATNHRCIAWAGDSGVSTTNVGKTCRTDSAVDILTAGTPTSARRVTGVAFNSTPNMVLTWDGTPAAAYLVGYILIGGSDVTNVKVGTHTMANSTGDKTETGVGFQGDFGMFLFTFQTAAGTATRANASMGFAVNLNDSGTSRARQFGMCWGVDDGQTMAANIDGVSYTNNANFLSYILDGAETIDVLAQFGTSTVPLGFASDGFRYNISNAAATNAQLMFYLIIKGGQWDCGTTTIDSGATRTISTMTFQPKALFVAHTQATTDATVALSASSQVGAATSTSSEAALGLFHNDNINAIVTREIHNDKITGTAFSAGTGVDFTSLNSDGWTITSEGTPGVNYQLGWFAPGDSPVTFIPEDDSWNPPPPINADPITSIWQ